MSNDIKGVRSKGLRIKHTSVQSSSGRASDGKSVLRPSICHFPTSTSESHVQGSREDYLITVVCPHLATLLHGRSNAQVYVHETGFLKCPPNPQSPNRAHLRILCSVQSNKTCAPSSSISAESVFARFASCRFRFPLARLTDEFSTKLIK